MMGRILKWTRRVCAIIVLLIITLLFVDFAGFSTKLSVGLVEIQFVPVLLRGSLITLAILFISTILFGRVYCSIICPLGILQDVILRIKLWWLRLTKGTRRIKTRYERPLNTLRYSVLAICTLSTLFGVSTFLLLLDPYSNFGRIAVNLFKPIVVISNNFIAFIASQMGNYSLYQVPMAGISTIAIVVSLIILAILAVLVWRKERIWCNTICPVGTLLGLLSRVSLFRISIDESKCTHCKVCATACKSRCIDADKVKVDLSRCVACYNCIEKCKSSAISYSPIGWSFNRSATKQSCENTAATDSISRKSFISATAAITLPAISSAAGRHRRGPHNLPMPPGAGSKERFKDICTACGLCIAKCPTQVLKPALMENGWDGILQPVMKFSEHSFCEYECNICSQICPTDALQALSIEQKKLTQLGVVRFHSRHCVVKRDQNDCGACAEHCPTQAITMVPYKGTLTIPYINPSICIGCGACESICPERGLALYVAGSDTQTTIVLPETEEQKDVNVDDFGF